MATRLQQKHEVYDAPRREFDTPFTTLDSVGDGIDFSETAAGLATPLYARNRQNPRSSITSVDILHIPASASGGAKCAERLNHAELVHHFGVSYSALS